MVVARAAFTKPGLLKQQSRPAVRKSHIRKEAPKEVPRAFEVENVMQKKRGHSRSEVNLCRLQISKSC
jgi:hypothetical protein